ncbi:hypothetical protein BJV82DRAFT_129352 [Fennellomyces sp. T-0311]|nr:hypothetical protein BJV82DRAFT_129352 [Fennellomyces sp. T-0311]
MPDLQTIDRVEEAPVVMASYYQLPKWTVDISNISAISVLKQQPKKRSPFSTSTSSKPKSFCVRTFDGQCYVMKAQKHKDLERWLFVLTKMWKFAQTIRNQLQQQQKKTTPVPVQPSPSYRPSSRHIWEPAPETMHRPVVDANSNMMMRNLVPPPPPHQEMARPSPYDNRYKAPMLSMEKVQWIDQWRESLAELAAYDTSPPPIEPIPDDDKMSTISGLTSISLREKSAATRKGVMPRRKPSKRSIRSVASALKRSNNDAATTKSNSIAPADASSAAILPQELPLEDRPSTSLKKKRSDEVKNWISNNTAAAQAAPDIDFFQDAKTILDGDGYRGGSTSDNINQQEEACTPHINDCR